MCVNRSVVSWTTTCAVHVQIHVNMDSNENVMRILVGGYVYLRLLHYVMHMTTHSNTATDNHLGYMERDPVRGSDSLDTFKEILTIAKDRDV